MDAGFIHVVEIGQYFMTKDTEEHFYAKSCREYNLPRTWEIFILRLCSIEEIDASSSSWTTCASRRRWGSSNSGELNRIFRNISCIALIGLTASGRHAWQEEEETRKDSSCTDSSGLTLYESELFKVIQDAILLILHFKTMS